ncbi:hypothetical protein PAPYR_3762 [Paratrimastix pyriformis]|uniref:B box-type domain-containing protein n=1 Tax=Paratrimastix pyriformis TaxID=342808 RepID=A0ABQ8ULH0_9EUKA|nr:hypothetical protein PAPYR_3762 [Paratrimastix pyriformis]
MCSECLQSLYAVELRMIQSKRSLAGQEPPKAVTIRCPVCHDETIIPSPNTEYACTKCQGVLCQHCRDTIHAKIAAHADSVTWGGARQNTELCPHHQQPLRLLCQDCNTIVCPFCLLLGPHVDPATKQPHRNVNVMEATLGARREVWSLCQRLAAREKEVAALVGKVDSTGEELAKNAVACLEAITHDISRMQAMLERRKQQLLDQCRVASIAKGEALRIQAKQRTFALELRLRRQPPHNVPACFLVAHVPAWRLISLLGGGRGRDAQGTGLRAYADLLQAEVGNLERLLGEAPLSEPTEGHRLGELMSTPAEAIRLLRSRDPLETRVQALVDRPIPAIPCADTLVKYTYRGGGQFEAGVSSLGTILTDGELAAVGLLNYDQLRDFFAQSHRLLVAQPAGGSTATPFTSPSPSPSPAPSPALSVRSAASPRPAVTPEPPPVAALERDTERRLVVDMVCLNAAGQPLGPSQSLGLLHEWRLGALLFDPPLEDGLAVRLSPMVYTARTALPTSGGASSSPSAASHRFGSGVGGSGAGGSLLEQSPTADEEVLFGFRAVVEARVPGVYRLVQASLVRHRGPPGHVKPTEERRTVPVVPCTRQLALARPGGSLLYRHPDQDPASPEPLLWAPPLNPGLLGLRQRHQAFVDRAVREGQLGMEAIARGAEWKATVWTELFFEFEGAAVPVRTTAPPSTSTPSPVHSTISLPEPIPVSQAVPSAHGTALVRDTRTGKCYLCSWLPPILPATAPPLVSPRLQRPLATSLAHMHLGLAPPPSLPASPSLSSLGLRAASPAPSSASAATPTPRPSPASLPGAFTERPSCWVVLEYPSMEGLLLGQHPPRPVVLQQPLAEGCHPVALGGHLYYTTVVARSPAERAVFLVKASLADGSVVREALLPRVAPGQLAPPAPMVLAAVHAGAAPPRSRPGTPISPAASPQPDTSIAAWVARSSQARSPAVTPGSPVPEAAGPPLVSSQAWLPLGAEALRGATVRLMVDSGDVLHIMHGAREDPALTLLGMVEPLTLAALQSWRIPVAPAQVGLAFMAHGVVYMGSTAANLPLWEASATEGARVGAVVDGAFVLATENLVQARLADLGALPVAAVRPARPDSGVPRGGAVIAPHFCWDWTKNTLLKATLDANPCLVYAEVVHK